MTEIVPMSDPRGAALPVTECGGRLGDVRGVGPLLVDTRERDPADAFAHLREGVAERRRLPHPRRGHRCGARAHRELLGSAPTAADPVNHPMERWHRSFGDR
ncbi:hypothetical protein [Streptomyces litmocidini]|uniref:hypothetical protein n=1 Tax=Streptomyces litmocidini TaxID=67318 RepID=UPI0036F8D0F3